MSKDLMREVKIDFKKSREEALAGFLNACKELNLPVDPSFAPGDEEGIQFVQVMDEKEAFRRRASNVLSSSMLRGAIPIDPELEESDLAGATKYYESHLEAPYMQGVSRISKGVKAFAFSSVSGTFARTLNNLLFVKGGNEVGNFGEVRRLIEAMFKLDEWKRLTFHQKSDIFLSLLADKIDERVTEDYCRPQVADKFRKVLSSIDLTGSQIRELFSKALEHSNLRTRSETFNTYVGQLNQVDKYSYSEEERQIIYGTKAFENYRKALCNFSITSGTGNNPIMSAYFCSRFTDDIPDLTDDEKRVATLKEAYDLAIITLEKLKYDYFSRVMDKTGQVKQRVSKIMAVKCAIVASVFIEQVLRVLRSENYDKMQQQLERLLDRRNQELWQNDKILSVIHTLYIDTLRQCDHIYDPVAVSAYTMKRASTKL